MSELTTLLGNISSQKSSFVTQTRADIYNLISSKQPSQCIMVTTTSPTGEVVEWNLSDGTDFFSRFYHFLTKKDYVKFGKTYKLDSALTNPIVAKVTSNYESLILSHQDELIDIVLLKMVTENSLRDALVDHIVVNNPSARIARGTAKKVITELLIGGLRDKVAAKSSAVASEIMSSTAQILSQTISSGVAHKAAMIAAKTAASSVGKIAISKLAVVISKSLIPVLGKLLAKPAIAMMMKKFVITAVLGSFVKIAAAKLGLSFGAALWIILLPLLAAWIKRDIDNFPTTLASEISSNVAVDIDNNFEANISVIFDNLINSFTEDQTIQQLTSAMTGDRELMSSLSDAVQSGQV